MENQLNSDLPQKIREVLVAKEENTNSSKLVFCFVITIFVNEVYKQMYQFWYGIYVFLFYTNKILLTNYFTNYCIQAF